MEDFVRTLNYLDPSNLEPFLKQSILDHSLSLQDSQSTIQSLLDTLQSSPFNPSNRDTFLHHQGQALQEASQSIQTLNLSPFKDLQSLLQMDESLKALEQEINQMESLFTLMTHFINQNDWPFFLQNLQNYEKSIRTLNTYKPTHPLKENFTQLVNSIK